MKFAYLLLLVLCSCSLVKRSDISNHQNTEIQSYYYEQNTHYANMAREQLGLVGKTNLSTNERNSIYWRTHLLKEEQKLPSGILREQYFLNRPYFQSDRERLSFLKIDSFTEREAYLAKNIRMDRYPSSTLAAIKKEDIVPNMTREAVIASWGNPQKIDRSGNEIYANERWTYLNYVSSVDGEIEEKRYLYFENGQLVAWETKRY